MALPSAVVASAALVAVAIVGSSRSTQERLDRLEQLVATCNDARPPTELARPATASPPAPRPVAVDRPSLTQADFERAWGGSEAQARAERECWAPADAEKRVTDPTPQFDLTVASDGRLATIDYDPRADERFPGLYPCIRKVLQGLRLSPGERQGAVQVNRATPRAP